MADKAAARIRLGVELRQAREATGMTQMQVAAALGCKQPKINRIETTQRAISDSDLDMLLRIYQPPEDVVQRIRTLAAECKLGASAKASANNEYLKMLDLEAKATEILALYSERIPNLFQSEHYIVTQYQVAKNRTPMSVVMEARKDREARLVGPTPPRYRALFGVSSMYRMPGGESPAVVIDQARHFLHLMDYENLIIQFVPWKAKLPYFPPDLTVLRSADPANDVAYVETGTAESRFYRTKKSVTGRIKDWQMVEAAALSVDDSRKFLHERINEARSW